MKVPNSLQQRSPVQIVAIAGLAAFAVLWSIYQVLLPISTDHGVFLWAGHVIRNGGVMYRDAWETRGPAPFYFMALLGSIFGHNSWSIRLADLLIQAVGTAAVALTVRRAGGTRTSTFLARETRRSGDFRTNVGTVSGCSRVAL